MKKAYLKTKSGYTIIEMMIAVSVFLVVVTIGIGALLNANLLHQKSRDMRSIMDNLSFIMEDMSRNLRTGSKYRCYFTVNELILSSEVNIPRSCLLPINGWGIAFEAAKGSKLVYFIANNTLFKSFFKSSSGDMYIQSDFIELTPKEVIIDPVASGFVVSGAEPPPGDTKQPFVTIRLVGKIKYNNVETPFSLQTSVSQRLIDI